MGPIPLGESKANNKEKYLSFNLKSYLWVWEGKGDYRSEGEMAPPAAAAAAVAEQRQQQGGFGQTITGIIRIAVFWYFASKFFSPKRPSASDPPLLISNLFQKGESLVLKKYFLFSLLGLL